MMQENYYITQDDKLLYNQDVIFAAPASITEFLIIGENIIVLVTGNQITGDRNIYCYEINGNLKWQVENPDNIHSTNYYTSIYLSNDNELQAYSKNGIEYTLNADNGTFLKKELIK
jgi:hypothetical protein